MHFKKPNETRTRKDLRKELKTLESCFEPFSLVSSKYWKISIEWKIERQTDQFGFHVRVDDYSPEDSSSWTRKFPSIFTEICHWKRLRRVSCRELQAARWVTRVDWLRWLMAQKFVRLWLTSSLSLSFYWMPLILWNFLFRKQKSYKRSSKWCFN